MARTVKQGVAKVPGRPKDPGKKEAILKAAKAQFMRHGFDRASMDAIADAADVSKLTLYSHFGNKEKLFQAMVVQKCSEVRLVGDWEKLKAMPPKKAFSHIADRFLDLILQQETLDMFRVVVAEAVTKPKISQLLYEAAPQRVKGLFAELLTYYHGKGQLTVKNPRAAANHFFAMLKGEPHDLALFNLKKKMTPKERQAHLDDCVGVFLRAFSPK
jgi:TetR/AcrR family transcriptional regulator, mexJK operon transcriptional repressor